MLDLVVTYIFDRHILIVRELQAQGYVCDEPIRLDMDDNTYKRIVCMRAKQPSTLSALETWYALRKQPWFDQDSMRVIVCDDLCSVG